MIPKIKISGVHKIFNKGDINEVYALNNINIEFQGSEFALIVGPNGSGKSTLLNILDGRLEPSQGNIFIDGNKINKLKTFQRATYIYRLFQETWNGVIPLASIRENLAFANKRNSKFSLIKPLVNKSDDFLFKSVIEEFNPQLSGYLGKKVFNLSPGERQAIVLSLLKLQTNLKPQILLADEPTAALDPEMAEKSISLLNELIKKGWLCIVVTHDERLINAHNGRLVKLKKGMIEYDSKN
jgi:putative tryptophan/tyrosine transport system ATP-binding protein